jgi:amino acid transporter
MSERDVLRTQTLIADTKLMGGAIGLPGALMQCVTNIAPALGLWFLVQFLASVTGIVSPVTLTIGFILMLMCAASVAQLAKHLPSAGGFFTYLSRTIHPRVGFMAGWLFFIYQPLSPAVNPVFMGLILQNALRDRYGFAFPWWTFFLIVFAFVAVVAYRGIRFSAEWLIGLGLTEVIIVLGLGIWGLSRPGPGGFNFAPFNPARAPSLHGLYLGIVASLLVLAGWENGAPVAEETRNPRRYIPRAIVGSVVMLGILQMIACWGLVVGWGTTNVTTFAKASEIPPFILAQHYWGGAWLLALLALVNSCLALSVSATTASTRVAYSMAQSGALPSFLGKVHPKHRTPVNAIHAQLIIMLVVGLGLGFWVGPLNEWFTISLAFTLALLLIYVLSNIGVIIFYRREKRAEFNPWLHMFFPLASAAAFIWVGYKSVVPLPPQPAKYAPIVLMVWIALGGAVLLYLRRRGRETWMFEAVKAATEHLADRRTLSEPTAKPDNGPREVASDEHE